MTPEQIEALARGIAGAAGGPPWWSYPLMLILAGLGAWVGTYLQEKGKNLATKEDIAEITTTVESAKRLQQELLEDFKANHQLRIVAVERRMDAHQQAFRLWRRMCHVPFHDRDGRLSIVAEATQWWEQNCIFLGPRSREDFRTAYISFGLLSRDTNQSSKITQIVLDLGDTLLQEVDLPPLSASQRSEIQGTLSSDYF